MPQRSIRESVLLLTYVAADIDKKVFNYRVLSFAYDTRNPRSILKSGNHYVMQQDL